MFGSRSTVTTVLLLLCSPLVSARPITLGEALTAAEKNPRVTVATATIEEGRANLEQAGTFAYNPVLGLAAGPSRGGSSFFFDFEVSLSQAFELGGKRVARQSVAKAELAAATEDRDATRNELRAEVRRTFQLALVASERVGVTTENEVAARQFQDAARERLQLGAATQTEVNVAVSSLGRAIVAKKAAERDLLLAREALADAAGLPGVDLEPVGTLPTFPPSPPNEDELVRRALTARRDLVAAEQTRSARDAGVELADALATPDPELSISFGRDAIDNAYSVVAGVRFELPVWNKNQGGRDAARAQRNRAAIEAQALRMEIERETRTTARRYRAALDAASAFDEQVVGTLGENLKLARDSLAAGKLGLLDLNNVRRDLVESQLTRLDAIAEAVESRAALERAIGQSLETTP